MGVRGGRGQRTKELGTGRGGKQTPFASRLDTCCSPIMTSALEEDVDVLTDDYSSGHHQSGVDSAGDHPVKALQGTKHSVIPAGKKGKQARKRRNKTERKKETEETAETKGDDGDRRGTRPRPGMQEAATRAADFLRRWTVRNGWDPSKAKRGIEASRPRPAACWLVALDGMARGMLSLWDVWVGTVKEGVYSGRRPEDCLSVPLYAGRGEATGAMGISPATVVSALRYRYASWAFRHVEDFRAGDHPRQFPTAFQRGLLAKEVRENGRGVVDRVKGLVAQVHGVGGTPWDGLEGVGAAEARAGWVENEGRRYALVEGLWRSTCEGETVMHVVAVGHGILIDTDWVQTVDVREVGVERAVEALTNMAMAAILVHTQYAMLVPGVEEVRRTAGRAEGPQLGDTERGLYAKYRAAGGWQGIGGLGTP